MSVDNQIMTAYAYNAYTQPFTFPTATSIAGWTLEWTLNDVDGNQKFVVTPTVVDSVNGVVNVVLTAAQLSLTPGVYRWELARTDVRDTLATGTLILRTSITP